MMLFRLMSLIESLVCSTDTSYERRVQPPTRHSRTQLHSIILFFQIITSADVCLMHVSIFHSLNV